MSGGGAMMATMGKVTCGTAISVDGFVAGPNQSLENPLGEGVEQSLHRWMFEQPDANADEMEALTAADAFIMGRNMFGPIRGEWDLDWRGWWGDDPPYHAPVFVLTHYPREPLPMDGGTTFYFVTDGIESALDQARGAAGEGDVAISGGAATINAYLAAGLIDELSLHVAPVALGSGERLFDGVGPITMELIGSRGNELVTHTRYRIVH
jgi:dihydrofolate reductase